MGNFAASELLVIIVFGVIFVIPLWKILPRAGMSKWLSLFGFLPPAAFLLWFILAFKKWPNDHEHGVK